MNWIKYTELPLLVYKCGVVLTPPPPVRCRRPEGWWSGVLCWWRIYTSWGSRSDGSFSAEMGWKSVLVNNKTTWYVPAMDGLHQVNYVWPKNIRWIWRIRLIWMPYRTNPIKFIQIWHEVIFLLSPIQVVIRDIYPFASKVVYTVKAPCGFG